MDCLADPAKIRVIADLSDDVQEAMPYLAAVLTGAGYNHKAGVLSLVQEGRLISLCAKLVVIAKADDEADAQEILDWLRGQINEAFANRENITPCYNRLRVPTWIDIYRLLPKTNCQLCGEAGCSAMAGRYILGQAGLDDCPVLREPEFARNRQLIGEWLGLS
jgi:ArsR family metal-binding transcriptional regulator